MADMPTYNRRVNMSFPSTEDEGQLLKQLVMTLGIDYASGRLHWLETWMLDPEHAYPFVEWDDLSTQERAWIITCRIGKAVEQIPDGLEQRPLADLPYKIEDIAKKYDDQWEATLMAGEALKQAQHESEVIRALVKKSDAPQPATPGRRLGERW